MEKKRQVAKIKSMNKKRFNDWFWTIVGTLFYPPVFMSLIALVFSIFTFITIVIKK